MLCGLPDGLHDPQLLFSSFVSWGSLKETTWDCLFPHFTALFLVFFNTMPNTFYSMNEVFFVFLKCVCVYVCVCACMHVCVCPVGGATVRTSRTVNQSRVSPVSMSQTLMRRHCLNTKTHDATKGCTLKRSKPEVLPSSILTCVYCTRTSQPNTKQTLQ